MPAHVYERGPSSFWLWVFVCLFVCLYVCKYACVCSILNSTFGGTLCGFLPFFSYTHIRTHGYSWTHSIFVIIDKALTYTHIPCVWKPPGCGYCWLIFATYILFVFLCLFSLLPPHPNDDEWIYTAQINWIAYCSHWDTHAPTHIYTHTETSIMRLMEPFFHITSPFQL